MIRSEFHGGENRQIHNAVAVFVFAAIHHHNRFRIVATNLRIEQNVVRQSSKRSILVQSTSHGVIGSIFELNLCGWTIGAEQTIHHKELIIVELDGIAIRSGQSGSSSASIQNHQIFRQNHHAFAQGLFIHDFIFINHVSASAVQTNDATRHASKVQNGISRHSQGRTAIFIAEFENRSFNGLQNHATGGFQLPIFLDQSASPCIFEQGIAIHFCGNQATDVELGQSGIALCFHGVIFFQRCIRFIRQKQEAFHIFIGFRLLCIQGIVHHEFITRGGV